VGQCISRGSEDVRTKAAWPCSRCSISPSITKASDPSQDNRAARQPHPARRASGANLPGLKRSGHRGSKLVPQVRYSLSRRPRGTSLGRRSFRALAGPSSWSNRRAVPAAARSRRGRAARDRNGRQGSVATRVEACFERSRSQDICTRAEDQGLNAQGGNVTSMSSRILAPLGGPPFPHSRRKPATSTGVWSYSPTQRWWSARGSSRQPRAHVFGKLEGPDPRRPP